MEVGAEGLPSYADRIEGLAHGTNSGCVADPGFEILIFKLIAHVHFLFKILVSS